jgi:hypothetical protein
MSKLITIRRKDLKRKNFISRLLAQGFTLQVAKS